MAELSVALRVRLANGAPRECAGYRDIVGRVQRMRDVLPSAIGFAGYPSSRTTCALIKTLRLAPRWSAGRSPLTSHSPASRGLRESISFPAIPRARQDVARGNRAANYP
jgi:hypothetical protein